MNTGKIRLAEKIINDYCQVIQLADVSLYGMPDSLLGYSKSQIKQAIMTALSELDVDEVDLRESLVQSYLHLARFIPEGKADITRRGQEAILSGNIDHPDMQLGESAIQIINEIKLEMEQLREEISAYLSAKREQRYE
jgi:hypothetical protein